MARGLGDYLLCHNILFPPRSFILILLLLLVLAAVLAACEACRGPSTQVPQNDAEATPTVRLYLISDLAGALGGGKLAISADETTNALVITAQPDVMAELEQVIAKLDIRRAQVLVEAIIVEISDGDGMNLGVQWANTNGGGTQFTDTGLPIGSLAIAAKDYKDNGNTDGQGSVSIIDISAGAANATVQTATFTALLAGISAVSLLVGGIGIMNIMLVSVRERTREIGVRMAVGARRRDILLQFLVEAIVVSLAGGIAGVGLGYGAAALLANFGQWAATVPTYAVVLALSVSVIIGLVFGVGPARRAARLDPVEALRFE